MKHSFTKEVCEMLVQGKRFYQRWKRDDWWTHLAFLTWLCVCSVSHVQGDAEDLAAVKAFVSAAWPRLEAWFNWFNTTQAGAEPTNYRCDVHATGQSCVMCMSKGSYRCVNVHASKSIVSAWLCLESWNCHDCNDTRQAIMNEPLSHRRVIQNGMRHVLCHSPQNILEVNVR